MAADYSLELSALSRDLSELKQRVEMLVTDNGIKADKDAAYRRKMFDALDNLDESNMPSIVKKISKNGDSIAQLTVSYDGVALTVSGLESDIGQAQSAIQLNAEGILLQSRKINVTGVVGGQFSPTYVFTTLSEAAQKVKRGTLWCCGYSHWEMLDYVNSNYTAGRIYSFDTSAGWSYTNKNADYTQDALPTEPTDGQLWACTGAPLGYERYQTYKYNGYSGLWEKCVGFVSGEQIAEIKTSVDDNAATISQIVTYDGGAYTANASFILQALNNAPSSATLSANKLAFITTPYDGAQRRLVTFNSGLDFRDAGTDNRMLWGLERILMNEGNDVAGGLNSGTASKTLTRGTMFTGFPWNNIKEHLLNISSPGDVSISSQGTLVISNSGGNYGISNSPIVLQGYSADSNRKLVFRLVPPTSEGGGLPSGAIYIETYVYNGVSWSISGLSQQIYP